MISINLLPVRQIKKRIQCRNEVILVLLLLAIVIAGLSCVGYSQNLQIDKRTKKIALLKKEKAGYMDTIKRIAKLDKERADLERKLEVIKSLKFTSQLPVRVLDEIASLTPSERIWLQSLKLDTKSAFFSAMALDNRTVADYMISIKESPFFVDADLKGTSMSQIGEQKLRSFSMTLAIEQPESKKTAQ